VAQRKTGVNVVVVDIEIWQSMPTQHKFRRDRLAGVKSPEVL